MNLIQTVSIVFLQLLLALTAGPALFASTAVSAETVSYKLLTETQHFQIVDQCLNSNWKRINNLNLDNLKRLMHELTFFETSRSPRDEFFGRRTAFFRSKTVFIHESVPQPARALILLHESLGALGYDDQDYEKSILLTAFCGSPSLIKPRLLVLAFKGKHFSKYAGTRMAGGATIVGGGGDAVSAYLKLRVIQKLINRKNSYRLLQQALRLPFEPNTNSIETKVKLRIVGGLIHVLVPLSLDFTEESILRAVQEFETQMGI